MFTNFKLKPIIIGASLIILGACSQNNNSSIKSITTAEEDSFQLELSRSNIVNGEPVTTTDVVSKSTVALYLANPTQSGPAQNFCTGTLITKTIVLTAAHCVKDVAEEFLNISLNALTKRMRVGFGLKTVKNENNPLVTFVKVKQLIVHPDYVTNMVENAQNVPMPDLAILLLESEAPSDFVPAEMGFDPQLIQQGLALTLAGYGYTSGTELTLPGQLMKVDVTVSEPHLTSAQFAYSVVDGKSACMGDSGGPAYITTKEGNLILVGVTSWGDSTCSKVGVYTSIPAFEKFISSSIASLSLEP